MLVPDRVRALIVDDNAYARAATAATLRKLGLVQIAESETGSAALLSLLAERFDILFMDWYMPEMSGAALLETVRDPRFGQHGALPIVLMTAYPSREVLTRARELGVSPAELRRKNFITTFPHQTPVIMNYDAGDFGASLDAAMKAADYAGFPARQAKAKSEGKLRGIGFSCYIEACGIAPSKAVGSLGAGVGLWESAEVRVNPVGQRSGDSSESLSPIEALCGSTIASTR